MIRIKLSLKYSNYLGLLLSSLIVCSSQPIQAQPYHNLIPQQHSSHNSNHFIKDRLVFSAPPPPEDIGQPGRRSDTGSRNNCIGKLPQSTITPKKALTAIVPIYNSLEQQIVFGLTTLSHPTFWFYVPYNNSFTGQFVILNQEEDLIYRTKIDLSNTPGFISVSLPSSEPPLKTGQLYHWYFKIQCKDELKLVSFVDGWTIRHSSTSLKNAIALVPPKVMTESGADAITNTNLTKQINAYAASGIWYDALDKAFTLYNLEPNNSNLIELLESVGLQALLSENDSR